MNTWWHFLQRCWASEKMPSVLGLLILKASFPAIMEFVIKGLTKRSLQPSLREEGRSCSILHEINKGFTLFSMWKPQVAQSKPSLTFWAAVGPCRCSHSTRGSMLMEALLRWTHLSPVVPGQGLSHSPQYTEHHTQCVLNPWLVNEGLYTLWTTTTHQLCEETHSFPE